MASENARRGWLPRSLAIRLMTSYAVATLVAMSISSAIFYFGTIGILSSQINTALRAVSSRLANTYEQKGPEDAAKDIIRMLSDDVEVDTELYALADSQHRIALGNLSTWPDELPMDSFVDDTVLRGGREVFCRLLARQLADGRILVVGRTIEDQRDLEQLVARALAGGATLVLVLAVAGAAIMKRSFDRHIAAVRHTAASIDSGRLDQRIPVSPGATDEFSQLSRSVNHMLDRIQLLIDGIRQISNAIAHELRTPLTRIRGLLDDAILSDAPEKLPATLDRAITAIDDVTSLFDKLLLISEVESGAIRHALKPVSLAPVLTDIGEMFDAMAEDQGVALEVHADDLPEVEGDKDLLASAVANLVGNALKYAGEGGRVRVHTEVVPDWVRIVVEDNGPGIPPEARDKVMKRFFRLESARGKPGHGLGLALVAAVTALHQGRFRLEDAAPGLRAVIELPRHGSLSNL